LVLSNQKLVLTLLGGSGRGKRIYVSFSFSKVYVMLNDMTTELTFSVIFTHEIH
jgi:hypothetical protein